MSDTRLPFRMQWEGDWPNCLYEPTLLCGERETAAAGNDSHFLAEQVRRGWHVADFCNCPSCPVRCAISGLVHLEKKAR